VWYSRSFRIDMEKKFSQKLSIMSWKHQLRAGRMALSWESMTTQFSMFRVIRMAYNHPYGYKEGLYHGLQGLSVFHGKGLYEQLWEQLHGQLYQSRDG
jgi:hypothetical protein